ncbi:RagB/SusD family nutrient uptake outer membrane protein [Sphingobacterium bovistauri]|uniref:RagB/SusD family protein n=1 Tax=Sphingobacterium bovistauri TaxID=2781959 RepID=A0ABS7Z547_9SPHI|nr:RagB/SusD family nutrient uptake outer membrane protein [Sphingobacterium bovistauri]MCA5003869.1 RagB/SusD family protein [Sphingobacterium bovistauri]
MKRYIVHFLLLGSIGLASCSKYFDVNTRDMLLDDDYVKETNELYSGYIGVASKMQAIADQTIFLSDLRSDLLEPTQNAPQELWDIYNFKEAKGNEFANPSGYYDLIVNANNYISKVVAYKKANPKAIEESDYRALLSGTIRFKVWTYFTLGKLYGKVAYFDNPNLKLSDINTIPTVTLDELIPKLLQLMEVGVEGVNGLYEANWANILFPGIPTNQQDLVWNMICPSPLPLLMELQLWAKQYDKVVTNGMNFIYDNGSARYKISSDDYNAEWVQVFTRDPITRTRVLINIVPYDYERNQTNRLIKFFSNTAPSVYYLRPTEVAMDRYKRQVRADGLTLGDLYRGENYTYVLQNGDWVFRKYSRDREAVSEIYKNNVHVTLYRDADVHFFVIEALNNLGKFKEAEALLNDGISTYQDLNPNNLQYPFSEAVQAASLRRNWGIRRRVAMSNVFPKDISKADLKTQQDSTNYKKALDKVIVEETLLESAGEAKAYFAMMRIAKRWSDNSIVADIVSKKYGAREQEIKNRLMNADNWYIAYPLD